MTSKQTEFRVGLAVILAAIILILGFLWIGEFRFNRRWQIYYARFDEIGGLSVGDAVTVAGLKLGQVGSISLEPDGRVKTRLLIEEGVVLKQDCSVEVRGVGLVDEKYIHVLPGNSDEVLAPGSVVEGKYTAGIADLAAETGDMMDELKHIAKSIDRVLATREGDPTLGESLVSFNSVAAELLSILKENRDDVRTTAKSMRAISSEVNDIVGSRKNELAEGIEKFSAAAARMDSLTVSLQEIVESVERGEGSLGMFIKEKKLYEELEASITNLNLLISDIKEHPERYLKIEIF
jgi:phospholipid/cholesterol/gamma-HCH transport system substrate-binding protein